MSDTEEVKFKLMLKCKCCKSDIHRVVYSRPVLTVYCVDCGNKLGSSVTDAVSGESESTFKFPVEKNDEKPMD